MSIELMMPSNHLILCHALLLLHSIFPSIRVFSNESVLRIRWPKYWSFGISPSNEYSGLISFRMEVGSPFSPWEVSQQSSPTPRFKRISSSNEYSGLISFRIYWLDLLAVQGTLKSLLQHHSSKASILQLSAFFMVLLSHSYMTTGKTIPLTRRQSFVGKAMSLLFKLSRLVIAFLPRSKSLLISWLQSPSAVILEPKK